MCAYVCVCERERERERERKRERERERERERKPTTRNGIVADERADLDVRRQRRAVMLLPHRRDPRYLTRDVAIVSTFSNTRCEDALAEHGERSRRRQHHARFLRYSLQRLGIKRVSNVDRWSSGRRVARSELVQRIAVAASNCPRRCASTRGKVLTARPTGCTCRAIDKHVHLGS